MALKVPLFLMEGIHRLIFNKKNELYEVLSQVPCGPRAKPHLLVRARAQPRPAYPSDHRLSLSETQPERRHHIPNHSALAVAYHTWSKQGDTLQKQNWTGSHLRCKNISSYICDRVSRKVLPGSPGHVWGNEHQELLVPSGWVTARGPWQRGRHSQGTPISAQFSTPSQKGQEKHQHQRLFHSQWFLEEPVRVLNLQTQPVFGFWVKG